MERLKEDEPDISHKERYLSTFLVDHVCVLISSICADLKWLHRTGKRRKKIPRLPSLLPFQPRLFPFSSSIQATSPLIRTQRLCIRPLVPFAVASHCSHTAIWFICHYCMILVLLLCQQLNVLLTRMVHCPQPVELLAIWTNSRCVWRYFDYLLDSNAIFIYAGWQCPESEFNTYGEARSNSSSQVSSEIKCSTSGIRIHHAL